MKDQFELLRSVLADLQKGTAWKVSRRLNGVHLPAPTLQRLEVKLDENGPILVLRFALEVLEVRLRDGRVSKNGVAWEGAKFSLGHRWRLLELKVVMQIKAPKPEGEEVLRLDAALAKVPWSKALRWRLAL